MQEYTITFRSEKRTDLNSGNRGPLPRAQDSPNLFSETISSYDRWYRSDTHVLRRTEGSSRLSDELLCRAIFTNLATPRRRGRRRRKEDAQRPLQRRLPSTYASSRFQALRVRIYVAPRLSTRCWSSGLISRERGDSDKKESSEKKKSAESLPGHFEFVFRIQ